MFIGQPYQSFQVDQSAFQQTDLWELSIHPQRKASCSYWGQSNFSMMTSLRRKTTKRFKKLSLNGCLMQTKMLSSKDMSRKSQR